MKTPQGKGVFGKQCGRAEEESNMMNINTEEFNPKIMFHYKEKASYEVSEHTHDFLTIQYVVSGRLTYYVNGQEIEAKKEDIIVLNPGTPHRYVCPKGKNEATIFYLGIENLNIKGYPQNFVPICSSVIPIRKYQHEIYNCYHEIISTQEKKDIGWDLLTKVLSQQFLVLVLKELSPQRSGSIQDYFQLKMYDKNTIAQTITNYFQENYMKKISVEEIARYTYLSTTYVTKIYKEMTGDTPINYLISLRMDKAKEILGEGHFSVQEVAKQVGYDDPYYFSKLFKKRYGCSPSEYKKKTV